MQSLKFIKNNSEFGSHIAIIYLGVDDIPLPDTQILQLDQIFLLEEPVPVATRDTKTSKV